MKRIFAIGLSIIFLLLVMYSCKDEPPIVPPPPPPPPNNVKDTLTLTFEYATHRSIIVNSKTTTNNKSSTIELYRQFNSTETLVAEYLITTNDTSIIDDNNGNGLQLNTSYTYYAVRIDSIGERKDSSNFVTATTPAATNFNYTWQEFVLGEPGSVLYDVWGTDENNVWAVGLIIINDKYFGALQYNGNEWLADSTVGGYAIYGFAQNDIWVVGGGIFYFDGQNWNDMLFADPILIDNTPYRSVWGTKSNNVYFGSGRGKIIHWNGSKAQIVYSDPDEVFVNDLDGYTSEFIIGVGTGMAPPSLAVKYDGTIWSNLPISNNWSLNSASIVTKNHIYFSGGGIFEMQKNKFTRIYNSGFYIWDIEYNRQTGVTVASGSFDGIYINNGVEWRDYAGQISSDETTYSGIFLTNSSIFCVGRNDTQAKILIGKN